MAQVSTSRRCDVSAQDMWDRIGDPGRIHEWYPGIEATEMLDGGRTRVDTLEGGGRGVETILELGERHMRYRLEEAPLPVSGLVGTLSVREDGEHGCVVEWEATFEPEGVPEDEAVEIVRGVLQVGLDAL